MIKIKLIGDKDNQAKGLQLFLKNGDVSSTKKWEFSVKEYLIDILKENKVSYEKMEENEK